MGDIFVPPSLSNANAALSIASSLEILTDPSERKKIVEDIKSFHALNDTEAKKAEEARSLIKKHSDVLVETHRVSHSNAQERKELEAEKKRFSKEMEDERKKINQDKAEAKEAFDKAKRLHDLALDEQKKTQAKEDALNKEKKEHESNVRKYLDDKNKLEKDVKDLEAHKEQVMALDQDTKAKVEKLKQFNF